MSVYRFKRKGSSQIIELSLRGETTVKECIFKAKDIGFLAGCDLRTVSVSHSSRTVNLSERLCDICVDSSDNLFVVDVEACEADDNVRMLCDMGFSHSKAIEALRKCGGDVNQAISCLLADNDERILRPLSSRGPAGNESFSNSGMEGTSDRLLDLKFGANKGNIEAQYNYGVCLYMGIGVAQNKREAARYFKMVADQGDVRGQFVYGSYLLEDDGVDQDKREAARYLKMAADKGYCVGQYNYGSCLSLGIGVNQDKRAAAHYFKLAADQGHCRGQYNYGLCLFNGDGVNQDKRRAAHYFKMAADQGDCDGQDKYGLCLFNGDGVEKDERGAARYFKMAADQGHCDGQDKYGSCLYLGIGVNQDKRAAAHYFKMAADQGHCHGQFSYGVCLLNGDGVEQDRQKAVRYFKMGADQGDCDGQLYYGTCLFNGIGVHQDKREAAHYFKMAAYQGDCDGQCNYGLCLANGDGVEQDEREAARYFEMAVDQGNWAAQYCYGLCLFNGNGVEQDKREAAHYFKMVADKGHCVGQHSYGLCLFNGDGVDQDKQAAAHYFKMAADQGNCDGQLYYGLCLFNGDGVEQDRRKAVRYLRMAADQGNCDGQLLYGTLMLRCKSSEAGRYVMLAAKSGLPAAQALYGIPLYHGKCVPWNPEEGIRYFEMASKNGDDLGQYCYAVHLLEECSGCIKENPEIVDSFSELSDKNGDATNLYALCTVSLSGSCAHSEFVSLLKQAIAQGCFCAKFNYASYLLHFYHDDDTRISEAIDLFNSVARQEQDSDDYYQYDSFLKRDLGVDSPLRWRFMKAEADAGYCESQFIYGKYLYSLGVHDEALQYFEKSAQNKHSEAMFAYAALSVHEFGGEWISFERYFKRAASDGVLLAQYNWGIHLGEDLALNVRVEGAKFVQMAAREILLRREAKDIKIGNNYSYPSFMYSPIPDNFVPKATDKYIIEHLSKNLGRLDRMTWPEIRFPKTLTVH